MLRQVVLATAALALAAAPMLADPASPRVDSPLAHDNLAVYFLRGQSASGPVPLTLEEAMARGTVIVHETGSVEELRVENTGTEPVFVQLGDIVKGGKQDRVLTVSMVLPPASGRVPIGAYCVEQGRWSARGGEDVTRFNSSRDQITSRAAKIALIEQQAKRPRSHDGALPAERRQTLPLPTPIVPRPAEKGEHTPRLDQQVQRRTPQDLGGQGAVWESVAALQRQLSERLAAPVAAPASHTSLQLTLENERLAAGRKAFIDALEAQGLASDEIVGVVVAVNGRISSADIYPSNGLFRKMWPKLIRAAATEAIAEKGKAAAPVPGVADVRRFLAEGASGEKRERDLSGIARLAMRSSKAVLATESFARDGASVHRNLVAR